jgi:hypothetical protein
LLLAFCPGDLPDKLIPKGPGTHRVPGPVAPCSLAVVKHGNYKDFRLSHCTWNSSGNLLSSLFIVYLFIYLFYCTGVFANIALGSLPLSRLLALMPLHGRHCHFCKGIITIFTRALLLSSYWHHPHCMGVIAINSLALLHWRCHPDTLVFIALVSLPLHGLHCPCHAGIVARLLPSLHLRLCQHHTGIIAFVMLAGIDAVV